MYMHICIYKVYIAYNIHTHAHELTMELFHQACFKMHVLQALCLPDVLPAMINNVLPTLLESLN